MQHEWGMNMCHENKQNEATLSHFALSCGIQRHNFLKYICDFLWPLIVIRWPSFNHSLVDNNQALINLKRLHLPLKVEIMQIFADTKKTLVKIKRILMKGQLNLSFEFIKNPQFFVFKVLKSPS